MFVRRIVLSLVWLLAISAPAASAPILAQFSRGGTSIANDGIGAPPAPVQVVNNFDHTGLVQTLLTDGAIGAGNFAQAFTHVTFGILNLAVFAESRDGFQKTATAEAGFQDVLTIAGAGTAGTTYHFDGSFVVTGSTSYLADDFAGSTALSSINVISSWAAFEGTVLTGYTQVGGAAHQFGRNSAGFPEGIDFLGTAIPVEFDFVWGNDIILVMTLGAGAAAHSGNGLFAASSVDMSNSLQWLGAGVSTLAGVPVNASLVGLSDTDWAQAAVPEPSAIMLVAVGLVALARRLRGMPSPPGHTGLNS
jgi:hypothetical protein